jgi:carboxyl-terminal processing protease
VIRRLGLLLAIVAASLTFARQDWRPLALQTFDVIWQTVNDTYYDPTFGGVNWAAVKAEYRPKIEAAASSDAAREVEREMLAGLGASHFAIITSAVESELLPGTAVVPVDIRVVGDEVVITRNTRGGDEVMRPGDRVIAIDGHPTREWVAAAQGPTARAKALDVWRRASRALYGPAGSLAQVILRNPAGEDRQASVPRVAESGQTVTLGNLPPMQVQVASAPLTTPGGKAVGLIAFSLWMTTIDAPVTMAIDRFRGAAGLVIDLRGNPGGLADMMRGIAGHILDEPALLGRMQMRDVQLEFKANPRRSTPDGRRVVPYAGPVAILVDELTASTSECFTGGLQSLGRVRVFGRETMGQALPAVTKQLPNGDVLMHVVGNFVTSTGQRLEGAGVTPDEIVPISIQQLASGRDATLDAALRWFDR